MAEEAGGWIDGLRKHHNEAADRFNRTQPLIDEQIKGETLKYLKNGTTKPKPKPGARKRKPIAQQTMQIQQQHQQTQVINQQQLPLQPQPQPPPQVAINQSQQQQQQQQQHQQHQLTNHLPQQYTTTTTHHNNNNNHHHHPTHQQYHPHLPHGHMMVGNHVLPDDLNLTLQAGLECDVDSLIKHEISVEGQLDFNHDLLLKLDNHYQFYNHHHHHHHLQHPQHHH